MQKEALIEEIVGIEWNMFDKVNNLGGRGNRSFRHGISLCWKAIKTI